jgi:hypothetical protein
VDQWAHLTVFGGLSRRMGGQLSHHSHALRKHRRGPVLRSLLLLLLVVFPCCFFVFPFPSPLVLSSLFPVFFLAISAFFLSLTLLFVPSFSSLALAYRALLTGHTHHDSFSLNFVGSRWRSVPDVYPWRVLNARVVFVALQGPCMYVACA